MASKKWRERNIISVRAGAFILSPKRASFSVRVNISIKDIINFHKKGIWDLNVQYLSKELFQRVAVYQISNMPYSLFFGTLWLGAYFGGYFLGDFPRFGEAGMKQQSYVQNSRLLSWKYYRKK